MNFNIKKFPDLEDTSNVNKLKAGLLIVFVLIITALAWQSDDAYHAYIMAKNLVDGNGFVYNVGERASASSCPLFTLVIACGYFVFRNMFLVSLLICIIFSTLAVKIIFSNFCLSKKQVIFTFVALVSSTCFISYTTSGLENSMLFFLAACFLKVYLLNENYNSKNLLILAILISLIAMTRMDAVLLFVPMVLYVYLAKRDNVSFIKAVFIGILGLLPFIFWLLFSTFYFGFPIPNTAFVKLGTNIPKIEYLRRGIDYILTSFTFDAVLFYVPIFMIMFTVLSKKFRYIYLCLGVLLYMSYVVYIGGDFMVGRHFTVGFFMSVICFLDIQNREIVCNEKWRRLNSCYYIAMIVVIVLTFIFRSNINLFENGGSQIADERAGYFKYTSLYNNTVSYINNKDMVIRDAWNEEGVEELRSKGFKGGILVMVPGITMYYNSDLYLNDLYALGDPFLSKLPAVRENDWRIGHMWREAPVGYIESVLYGDNQIKDESLKEYYEIIKLITRGPLWDKERIKAVIDINLGKYDYLIDNYKKTLDDNCHQITDEYYLSR